MAALVAGLPGTVTRAFSQVANPAARVTSAEKSHGQAALPAQPGQVKVEEAEEENLFRHTKLVQAISDAIFHDNPNAANPEQVQRRVEHVERTARTFEWINSAIIILVIVIPLARVLPRVMRRRSQNLKHRLEEARKTTADANTRLSAVEAQLARLDEEIAQIRANTEQQSKQDEARIRASMEEERARIVASAEQEITAAAAHAQRGLRHFAADLAIENAARQLILTPETDRALITEFLESAAPNGSPKGGHR
ncbi:MAG TPA: ATP synthase F0 subunit B [Terracidiphilus sp.]|nr:ATP synthase F0 subunit B [Terracidiphilus sp.]